MSISIPTPESLKEKAKVIRQFMKEKHNVDVPHGHCMEMISQLFGFKDWNTASAALKPKVSQKFVPIHVKTVGDMRMALESFKDSDYIDGMFEFNVDEFLSELDGYEDSISQEFSFILEDLGDDGHEMRFASFKLKLEEASASYTS